MVWNMTFIFPYIGNNHPRARVWVCKKTKLRAEMWCFTPWVVSGSYVSLYIYIYVYIYIHDVCIYVYIQTYTYDYVKLYTYVLYIYMSCLCTYDYVISSIHNVLDLKHICQKHGEHASLTSLKRVFYWDGGRIQLQWVSQQQTNLLINGESMD